MEARISLWGKRLLAWCSQHPSGQDHAPEVKSFMSCFIPRLPGQGQCWAGDALQMQVLTVSRPSVPGPGAACPDGLCTSEDTPHSGWVPTLPGPAPLLCSPRALFPFTRP